MIAYNKGIMYDMTRELEVKKTSFVQRNQRKHCRGKDAGTRSLRMHNSLPSKEIIPYKTDQKVIKWDGVFKSGHSFIGISSHGPDPLLPNGHFHRSTKAFSAHFSKETQSHKCLSGKDTARGLEVSLPNVRVIKCPSKQDTLFSQNAFMWKARKG